MNYAAQTLVRRPNKPVAVTRAHAPDDNRVTAPTGTALRTDETTTDSEEAADAVQNSVRPAGCSAVGLLRLVRTGARRRGRFTIE